MRYGRKISRSRKMDYNNIIHHLMEEEPSDTISIARREHYQGIPFFCSVGRVIVDKTRKIYYHIRGYGNAEGRLSYDYLISYLRDSGYKEVSEADYIPPA